VELLDGGEPVVVRAGLRGGVEQDVVDVGDVAADSVCTPSRRRTRSTTSTQTNVAA
jgi:hypothetical protein